MFGSFGSGTSSAFGGSFTLLSILVSFWCSHTRYPFRVVVAPSTMILSSSTSRINISGTPASGRSGNGTSVAPPTASST